MLTKEQILRADDILTEEVEVPEWGGSVLVRGLTGADRDRWQDSLVQGAGRKMTMRLAEATARLVALSIVDEKGNRVFSDIEARELNRKSGAVLNKIYEVACRLSGLDEAEAEKIAKNSETLSQTEDSTSD